MAISAVKDLAGFIRRFSCNEGMTDATYGYPYGSVNTATAFSSPGKGAGGTDGWNTMAGAAGGSAAVLLPNDIGGPTPALGGGMGFQINDAGACSSMFYIDGGGTDRAPSNAATLIFCVRGTMNTAFVSDITNPATLAGNTSMIGASTGGGHNIGVLLTNNRAICGSLDSAQTAAALTSITAAREMIVVTGNTGTGSGSNGNGCTIMVVRNGAIVSKVSAGTGTANAANIVYLADDGSGSLDYRGIVEDFTICKATNTDADIIAACNIIRGEHEATAFAPTTVLDIIGDSFLNGYKTTNCATWPNLLQQRLGSRVMVNPVGITGSGAQTWAASTWISGGTFVFPKEFVGLGYNITRQVGLLALGTNDLLANRSSANFIADLNSVADAYLAATGSKPYALVPVCCGDIDPATRETRRRQYRTAMLASSHFAGVIDTDTLEPSLVPRASSAYACAECAGSLPFQIPTITSGGLTLPGTRVFNTKAIGVDGVHMGPVGHSLLAAMVARDTTSGFAQAIGAASTSGPQTTLALGLL